MVLPSCFAVNKEDPPVLLILFSSARILQLSFHTEGNMAAAKSREPSGGLERVTLQAIFSLDPGTILQSS